MTIEGRRERADAARNRSAILRAAEDLLTRHRPEEVSIEQVAAAAGVGKGTVFHRFGNRSGLMRALMEERALAVSDAARTGPPPLGAGAPPQDRLIAFLDALVDVITRNVGLVAALDHAITTQRHADADERHHGQVYVLWHEHISTLIAEARPDLDADLMAYILLGSLHNTPVIQLIREGASDRVAASLRVLAGCLLDSA
jgi:AcrR family transcriptional regulator